MSVVLATLSELHIILALIIVFLLFGGKKLPELARGIGEAMKEFKKAQREVNAENQQHQSYVPPAAEVHPQVTAGAAPQKPADPKLN
jgi:sec-independent protein translocase protein TatA